MLPIIGIIAGKGSMPSLIAANYAKKGGKCYIAALDGETKIELIKDFEYQSFKIGMVGAVIEYFHKNNVRNIIFAGGINRPNLRSIKVDTLGSVLIARIIKQKFLGDDKLLRIVAKFFEEKGFKVVSSEEILTKNSFKQNIFTKITADDLDLIDIELGKKVLNALSIVDVGQSVIVEDGYVLGIEAAEGTDNLIERCAVLRKKPTGGVLIKMMKSGQDERFDMPTIGPETITKLAQYHYKGIAIEEDSVIILSYEVTMQLVDKYKLFIKLFPKLTFSLDKECTIRW